MPNFNDEPTWERQVYSFIMGLDVLRYSAVVDPDEEEWKRFGIVILRTLLSPAKTESTSTSLGPRPKDGDRILSHILDAIESAKKEASSFLRDMALVCQILIPNFFCNSASQDVIQCSDKSTMKLKHYMALLHMENLGIMLESDLVQELITSWYAQSTGKSTNMLDFPRIFQGTTWPCIDQNGMTQSDKVPPSCLPLLGNRSFTKEKGTGRILSLPKSYTDLYAELNEMCPDIEQTALCLVCGQVSL